MRWIGICERAFDMMCQYAATRLLAPGKPLGSRQIVQEWIAESRAEINASRLLVMQAAEQIEHEGSRAAREAISIIKFYVANVLQRVSGPRHPDAWRVGPHGQPGAVLLVSARARRAHLRRAR